MEVVSLLRVPVALIVGGAMGWILGLALRGSLPRLSLGQVAKISLGWGGGMGLAYIMFTLLGEYPDPAGVSLLVALFGCGIGSLVTFSQIKQASVAPER